MLPEGSRRGGSTRKSGALSSFAVLATLVAGALGTTLAACSRTGLWLWDLPDSSTSGLSPDGSRLEPDGDILEPDGNVLEPDGNVLEPDAGLLDATVNRSILLFGGEEADGAVPTDTWIWFEGKWTLQDPAPPPPRGRYKHSMAPWNGMVLLYGGLANSLARNQLTETWQWDGTTWTQLSSDGPLSNNSPIAMADLNGTVVAYVLNTEDGASTWVWDGSWALRTTVGPPKSPAAVMARLGNQIIWTGSGETWAWDGSGWTQLSAPGPVGNPETAPSYMAGLASSLVFFIPPQSVATFMGNVFGGTAVFDGTSWNALDVPGPGPREDPAIAATPTEGILFGGAAPGSTGASPFGDTWAWGDGGSWTLLDASGPAPRSGSAMSLIPLPGAP